MTLLEVRDLHAHYGKSHILRGADLYVAPGEIVGLVGRNGSGRSTLLKAVMGLVPPSRGSVRFGARELVGRRPYEIARRGIAYVPEERLVFDNLTVEDNLRLGLAKERTGAPAWSIPQMYSFFPRLAERRATRAGSLSGGEQQMLTISRSLLGNPGVILIDEPTEGLAPMIVDHVMQIIIDIARLGVGVLLVEQKLTIVLKISRRLLVMGHGKIVFDGLPGELDSLPKIRRAWLEVSS